MKRVTNPHSILGFLPAFDFVADIFDGGSTGVGAGGEGAVEVEDFGCVGTEMFGDDGEVELIEGGLGLVGFGNSEADKFVGVAEGDAFD